MSYVKLGATIRLAFGTSDPATGAAVDADATPVVTVYEQGVALGYSPTVTGLAAGLYEVAVVCNSANGFEVGKEYTATVAATVGAVTARDGLGRWTVSAVSPDDLATAAALAVVDDFVDTEIADIQSRLPAALVAGRIDASVGVVAANAITASAVAADAVTEIQSGLATAAAVATLETFVDTEVATIVSGVADIQSRLPAALVAGRIDASVGTVAANAITASAVAVDAVTEIQSGLATAAALATLDGKADVIAANTVDVQSRLPAALVLGRIDASVGAVAADAIDAGAIAASAVTEIQSGLATTAALATLDGKADTITANTADIQSRLPVVLVGGRMNASVGAIATGAVDANALAADAATEIATAVDSALSFAHGAGAWGGGSGSAPTANEVADAVWDELLAGHVVSGSAGEALAAIQAKTDALPADPADASGVAAGFAAVVADTEDIQTRLPAALVAGRIDASVGAIAANTITASALAADAASEVATAVDAALSGVHGAGSWEGGAAAPTANEVADAVCDELLAGHAVAGSVGAALSAAAATQSDLFEIAGLLYRNSLIDNVVRSSGIIVSARVRVFANATALTAATVGAADGVDNEVNRFAISATVDGSGYMASYRIRKTL